MASNRGSERLLQASGEALEAAQAGDLERLSQALDARAAAIEAGEPATPEIVALGEAVIEQITGLQTAWSTEDQRLQQLEHLFAAGSSSLIDLEA